MIRWTTSELDSVDAVFDRAFEAVPDRLYLDFGAEHHTYADVAALTARTARGLAELGVGKGDRVVTVLDNNIDHVAAMLATSRLGAVLVPVNTAYRGEFLRHQIADSGAKIVIAEHDYAERIFDVAAGLGDVRAVLRRGNEVTDTRSLGHHDGIDLLSLDELREGADDRLPAPVAAPSDLCCFVYTAGTTGPSKGCMISHNYFVNTTRQYLQVSGRGKQHHTWTPLPLFHFNAWNCTVLPTAVLHSSATIAPRFSLSGFWPEIERSGATMTTLLGTILSLIANAPDSEAAKRCYGQLEIVQGAPFPPELEKKWKERFGVGWTGANVFGLTECCMTTSLSHGEIAKSGSSGRRNEDFDVRIFDDEDNELPAGEVGEIVVRPLKPHVMFEGYWNRPDATQNLMRNMWFHTGDLGRFDEDDFFYFVDRKKDYLRRRGENISSFEMETAFQQHPDVVDVAVHSVLSDVGEDDVKVTAVLAEGAVLTPEVLCKWSVERLPYFAIPRYIEFRAELPKNPVGRVLKYALRDEGVTAGTWDREKSGIEFGKR
ncbi:AMP-binding protein [Nocardia alni]|uniref:AMP-binding protein n=1 Tax=Nocardia alni TaxID=2815723 RepID=UPI0027DF4E0A|nr:AMP-binding protein [Nocardia alni]